MGGDIIDLIKTRMEGEINNFLKVWFSVIISLSYSYFTSKLVPKGTTRFITFLPVISLFFYLPLPLHSMHLGGLTAFFVSWLSNFKLILLAFNCGPLSDPSLSLPHFIALASLPIRIQQPKPDPSQNPSQIHQIKQYPFPQISENTQNPSLNGRIEQKPNAKRLNSTVIYAIKFLLLALIVKIYNYRDYIHPNVMLIIFFLHIYFTLEIALAMVAAAARSMFGFELEPQFDHPYLSTSLQDFWGKRWNLMVTRILRPSVYKPVCNWSTGLLGRQWASMVAVFATFCVSGLMHELIFYYMGRVRPIPTWEATLFFLLHGVCLVVEIAIKKWVNGKWGLPRVVTGPLTVAFVVATGYWLFLPPLLRMKAEVKAVEEFNAVGTFFKELSHGVTFKFR